MQSYLAKRSGVAGFPETAMTNATRELKIQAEILHTRIRALDTRYLGRLRILTSCRRSSDEQLIAMAAAIRRRDCLAVIAAELGFANWRQMKAALSGDGEVLEFGTLLYPDCGAGLNRWYTRYEDAATVRAACHGYLLAYRRQYLVVDRDYIESLGLDPADADWRELGFDWVRPASLAARTRLYDKLIAGHREREKDMGRKEAIEKCKSRKAARGVFAVRCTATGQVWVGSSPNLDAARNGAWFFLRHRYHHNKALQAEWNTHGEEAFQYEILETLDEGLSAIGVSDVLKEKKRDWVAQLCAQTL
jgi:hypothetical protein